MTIFNLKIDNPNLQYISFEAILDVEADKTHLFFPTWRPGRYELGNFAKNIKGFKVYNEKEATQF